MERWKAIGIFCTGAFGYGAIETAFRGYTHWSMVLTGGACFLALYFMNRAYPQAAFYKKCIAGGLVITLFEFAAGCVVNLWMGFDVWDYSNYNNNILGQICPYYTLHWFALCAGILLLARVPSFLRKKI